MIEAITGVARRAIRFTTHRCNKTTMDPIIIAAVAMLAIWAGVTFTTAAPGWVHLLLTAGMFLLIWRIVTRGSKSGTNTGSSSKR